MGVSIHYRGRVADIQNIKTICDKLTADELASIIEALLRNWFGDEESTN